MLQQGIRATRRSSNRRCVVDHSDYCTTKLHPSHAKIPKSCRMRLQSVRWAQARTRTLVPEALEAVRKSASTAL
jgi:hypothetical protein